MSILLMAACFLHGEVLTGVIDHKDNNQCVVILESSETVFITSNKLCNELNEGDSLIFKMRKK